IGLAADGDTVLSNGRAGVLISNGAQSNKIGNSATGGQNVISGNATQGVLILDLGTNKNVIESSLIGLNAAGTLARGNGDEGVGIFNGAQANAIGGSTASLANTISGNHANGISISDPGTNSNIVTGNYIGVNPAGTAAIPNAYAGVFIFGGAQSNTIGGSGGARNVISGNGNQGIGISGSNTNNNSVKGNYIGLNSAGTIAISNTYAGVTIFGAAGSNTIGGSARSRNVISGNGNQGITISGSNTKSNKVFSNYIGLNAAGSAAIPNTYSGVEIYDAASVNIIGGAGVGNIISGNNSYGVAISGTDTGSNLVQGNILGLDAGGAACGNAYAGVILFGGAKANTIGGSQASVGNLVSRNGSGIQVFDATTTSNPLRANGIRLNNGIGIDLVGGTQDSFGVTANDTGDGDNGPNNLQNYPVLTSALTSGTTTTVSGSLNSKPSITYRLEFFSDTLADPSGCGGASTYMGFSSVTTDATGNVSFSVQISPAVPSGRIITATATDPTANTSEFARNITAP